MSYSSEYYEKALTIIKDKKKQREKEYETQLDSLYTSIPQLNNIEQQLSALGAKAMKTAMEGKSEELKELEKLSKNLTKQKNEILKAYKLKKPSHECSFCNDTGYNGVHLCECVKTLAKSLVFADLSSTIQITAHTFSSFSLDYYEENSKVIMTEIFNFAKEYAENFTKKSQNLLFFGGVGLGKTHLSLAIINVVISKGYGAIYDTAENLFSKLSKEYFSYTGSTDKLDAVLNCDLLVIDDLGTEFITPYSVSQLYNIINTRINNGLPTIINTNLELTEIGKNYTPRVLSRIMGMYRPKKFSGSDIRLKKALEK